MILAGIAITAASVGFSVADSIWNITGKFDAWTTKILQSWFPNLNLLDIAIIKFVVMAILVLVCIALVIDLLVVAVAVAGDWSTRAFKRFFWRLRRLIKADIEMHYGSHTVEFKQPVMSDLIAQICQKYNLNPDDNNDYTDFMRSRFGSGHVRRLIGYDGGKGSGAAEGAVKSAVKNLQRLKEQMQETIEAGLQTFIQELVKNAKIMGQTLLKEAEKAITEALTILPQTIFNVNYRAFYQERRRGCRRRINGSKDSDDFGDERSTSSVGDLGRTDCQLCINGRKSKNIVRTGKSRLLEFRNRKSFKIIEPTHR